MAHPYNVMSFSHFFLNQVDLYWQRKISVGYFSVIINTFENLSIYCNRLNSRMGTGLYSSCNIRVQRGFLYVLTVGQMNKCIHAYKMESTSTTLGLSVCVRVCARARVYFVNLKAENIIILLRKIPFRNRRYYLLLGSFQRDFIGLDSNFGGLKKIVKIEKRQFQLCQ